MMTTRITTTLTCPTMMQGVVVVAVVHFLWLSFVCSYYVVPGEIFKVNAWEGSCRRHSLLDCVSLKSRNCFFLLPRLYQ